MKESIDLLYNHKKKMLTILVDGKPAGGFVGSNATRIMEKIVNENAEITVKDGNIQVGV
jgi:hypothetical protein